ncbi:flagellar motor switch protein FliG [Salipiger mucosus]|uniref:Flagellar motor switch protein FliG n=1 Tax=Salipiger mucosus DSM 16094 TaxID=1123237 RepID=S9Q9G8_9RHOB|nr:flagellar motor switch protein FliG [Salipiger mucosus]EPX78016.1 Flagellar motor switch protein FliG [Salipiger mucosus DSM 16094]
MSTTVRTDIKKISGSEKAAILFLCLGQERGSELMKQLGETQVMPVSRAIAGLGQVTTDVVEDVITEFVEGMTAGGGVHGNFNEAEEWLKSFLPEDQADRMMGEIRGPVKGKNMWARFSSLNENVIANYLRLENPQTVAAILSQVKADISAKVLPLLPEDMMQDVIERMIRMEAVPQDMLEGIETALETEFLDSAANVSGVDSHERMANIFNKFPPETFEGISGKLDGSMPDELARIKQKMFTFDDLARMDTQNLGRVIRSGTDGARVPTALKGAKSDVRDYFLQCLPERSRNLLKEEMDSLGPVRMRDVQTAQAALVDVAKELAEDGAIQLPMNDDEDEIIE